MIIVAYDKRYGKDVADLYHRAVHNISQKYYSAEQLEAWAPTPPNYDSWQQRLARTRPYIVLKKGRVAAFIAWEKSGKIDCMYTHPTYQRQGLGRMLYTHIQDLALRENTERLYTYASKVAKDFFLKQDFDLVRENQVHRSGIALTNFYMVKHVKGNKRKRGQGKE